LTPRGKKKRKSEVIAHNVRESFGQAFSKACEVEGAEPSSSPAGDEIFLGVSFCELFLCAFFLQRKSG
jgi:hypothetical protein